MVTDKLTDEKFTFDRSTWFLVVDKQSHKRVNMWAAGAVLGFQL